MIFLQFVPYHWDLKTDQTWKAEVSWHYVNKSAELDQMDVEELVFKVLGKDGESYKISTSRKLLRTELPGVSVKAPETTKAESTEAKVLPGQLFAMPTWKLDTITKRLSRLYDFGDIPAVETWQVRSMENGTQAAESVVDEVPSAEPSLRVWRWEFKELAGTNRMTGVGYLWTRKKDGFPIAMHIEAQNAMLPGGTDLATLVVDLKLKEDEKKD